MVKNLWVVALCLALVMAFASGCSTSKGEGTAEMPNSDTGGIVGQDPSAGDRPLTADEKFLNEEPPAAFNTPEEMCEWQKGRMSTTFYIDDNGINRRYEDVKYVPEREEEFQKLIVDSDAFLKCAQETLTRDNVDNLRVYVSGGPYTTTDVSRFARSFTPDDVPTDPTTEICLITVWFDYTEGGETYLIHVTGEARKINGKYVVTMSETMPPTEFPYKLR